MKLKKIKNKIEFSLLLIALIQIFLLINLAPADSYRLHQTDSLIKDLEISEGEDKIEKIINLGINLLIGFLSIKQIGTVSATEPLPETSWCCPEMKNGAICADILSTNTESCKASPIETSCENSAACKKGCCFDNNDGLCSTNSPKLKCESDGGEWSSDKTCSTTQCRKGCCVLGSNVRFTTEKNCEKISAEGGFNKDFRQIWNELECLKLSATQNEGACMLSGGICKFGTETECLSKKGNFYKNYLCSNLNLQTRCTKQSFIGCIPNRDEIYWFDSCGNRENTYSSDRDASWNNGIVLKKGDSCNEGSGNTGSISCGNCGRPLSKCFEVSPTKTHVQDGNFVCRDLGCEDAPNNVGTKDRINGEKWCLYDNYIGDGKDTVGSGHWLAYCHDGEVEIDRCGEYRGSLCQQQIIEEGGKSFSMASCTTNLGNVCMGYNPLQGEENEGNIRKCEKNKHCMIKKVEVDDYFKFDVCVSRYPKGADLKDGMDDNLCGIANEYSCTVYYEKVGPFGVWDCIENCDCETEEFAKQMNGLCISLGDCGNYINYKGGGADNVEIIGKRGNEIGSDGKETNIESECKALTRDPGIIGTGNNCDPRTTPEYSWTNYQSNKNPVDGQYVEPQDIDEFLAQLGGSGGNYNPENIGEILTWVGGISGVTGGLIYAAILISPNLFANTVFQLGTEVLTGAMAGQEIAVFVSLSSVATVAMCLLAGLAAASFLAQALGISGAAATVLVIAGGVGGFAIGLLMVNISNVWNVVGWVSLAVAAVVILWIVIFDIGQRETRIVEFKCMPWQAPTFNSEAESKTACSKCNEDPLRPCTKYRCNSLGQTCKILNEDQENPPCESIVYESNPPVISPERIFTEGYEFQDRQTKSVEIKSGREDGCIQEFSQIIFKLKTDESSQCKYSFEKPISSAYDEMEGNYPAEQNAFTINHTFSFNMPSVDSLGEITEEERNNIIERYGDMIMYIKCKDYWRNFNIDEYLVKFCVHSGPDLTPVIHALTVTKPRDKSNLKYGTTESDLTMWVNEPAECRYDIVKNKEYDSMENSMNCRMAISNEELFGWPCSTTLTSLSGGKNEFYIKCKDSSGNTNQDDFPYTLYVSSSELKIDSIRPKGKISTGLEPISVDMQVETSGGANNGISVCSWGVLEGGDRWLFYETFSRIHKQTLTPRFGGTHINYIECEDDAGNKASAIGQFIINVDSSPPKVVRAYHEGDKLKIITDEQAKCYYDFNGCNFNLENATAMTTGFSKVHTIKWNPGLTYYIKCKDIRESINPDCAIKIIPGS